MAGFVFRGEGYGRQKRVACIKSQPTVFKAQSKVIIKNLLRGKSQSDRCISVTVAMLFVALLYGQYGRFKPSIRIGVLHSLSGTMAVSEAPLVDAVRLAVEEANRPGGLNGQQTSTWHGISA